LKPASASYRPCAEIWRPIALNLDISRTLAMRPVHRGNSAILPQEQPRISRRSIGRAQAGKRIVSRMRRNYNRSSGHDRRWCRAAGWS
jgi:hypothetical protein